MPKVQTEIVGAERPTIPELDEAAVAYIAARDERMALTKRETETKATLAGLMHDHEEDLEETRDGDSVYVFEDAGVRFTCTLASSESLRVKRVRDDDGNDEDDIG